MYTPKAMEEATRSARDSTAPSYEWKRRLEEHYGDYHVNDKGMWWGLYFSDTASPADRQECMRKKGEFDVWVPEGQAPPASLGGLTARDLALLALERVRVPAVEFTSSPTTIQTVNLPTWLWTNSTAFRAVQVTATIEGTGLWSTVTAQPRHLTIDPGTSTADIHDGGCLRTGHTGRIGVPYSPGTTGAPPCGVTYHHASTQHSYPLTATLTWAVSWTSSTGERDDLADATSTGDPKPVQVQEIQTVVEQAG